MKNEALCSSHYANSPQVAGGKTESVFSGFYVQKTVPGGADLRRSGDAWRSYSPPVLAPVLAICMK